MLKYEKCPDKSTLLKQLNEVSFAISDILLYLDTHPCDQDALRYYRENMEMRKYFLTLYSENYGPLTIDSALDSSCKTWLWEEQPFPWERKGGCK